MRHYYQNNEEVPCYLKAYDMDNKTYIIETVSDHVTGFLKEPNHPVIVKILKNAKRYHKILILHFLKLKDGKLMFKFLFNPKPVENKESIYVRQVEMTDETVIETNKIEEDIVKKDTENDDTDSLNQNGNTGETTSEQESNEEKKNFDVEPFCVRLSKTDEIFDKAVLTSLTSAIGDSLDSPEKYDLAASLIMADNQSFHLDIAYILYSKATDEYKRKLWEDEIVTYCTDDIVKIAWNDADEDGKQAILNRFGITLSDTINQSDNQDNSQQTTQQVERIATEQAINERRRTQANLGNRRRQLDNRQQELNREHTSILHEQQEHQIQTLQRISQAHSEQERQQIQQESQQQQATMQTELHKVENQQHDVTTQITQVETQIVEAQEEINTIQRTVSTNTIGGRGKLKINLKWWTYDDVDLHVYDPDNNHIYYGDKQHTCQGVLGQLDVDANAGSGNTLTPQENIFWEDKAPIGHYKVNVNLYCHRSGASKIPFTVTFYPEKGEPRTCTGNLLSNGQTIHVMEFDYTKNGIVYNN